VHAQQLWSVTLCSCCSGSFHVVLHVCCTAHSYSMPLENTASAPVLQSATWCGATCSLVFLQLHGQLTQQKKHVTVQVAHLHSAPSCSAVASEQAHGAVLISTLLLCRAAAVLLLASAVLIASSNQLLGSCFQREVMPCLDLLKATFRQAAAAARRVTEGATLRRRYFCAA
jgi:hypothetical protein